MIERVELFSTAATMMRMGQDNVNQRGLKEHLDTGRYSTRRNSDGLFLSYYALPTLSNDDE